MRFFLHQGFLPVSSCSFLRTWALGGSSVKARGPRSQGRFLASGPRLGRSFQDISGSKPRLRQGRISATARPGAWARPPQARRALGPNVSPRQAKIHQQCGIPGSVGIKIPRRRQASGPHGGPWDAMGPLGTTWDHMELQGTIGCLFSTWRKPGLWGKPRPLGKAKCLGESLLAAGFMST